MRATLYDDGLACPGNCDAHVVFAPSHNGTRNAFKPPLANRANPTPCAVGEMCMICFDDTDSSCLEVLYRGAGPHRGAFDFTPAFYSKSCALRDLPAALREECDGLQSEVRRLGYDRRTNCFATPSDPHCDGIIERAESQKASDTVEREACLRESENAYNARQTNTAKQRALNCNYERFGTGGPNSKGKTWRRLLPGACRQGTYVGRDGLDCCSNNPLAAVALHPECSIYFPKATD
jgi:hypothetical protein